MKDYFEKTKMDLYEENQDLKRKLIVCQIRIEKLCVKKVKG